MYLKNINEVVADIRLSAEVEAKAAAARILSEVEKTVERTERNRLALMLLDGSGIRVGSHGNRYIHIDLGFFTKTGRGNARLAEKVSAIRVALGCRLEQTGKSVSDAKKRTVRFDLRPVEFPTVTVTFERKLPKDAKCRIKKSRVTYTDLVCEI